MLLCDVQSCGMKHTHTHTHMRMPARTHANTHTHARHVRAHIHTRTHAHARTHTHTHTKDDDCHYHECFNHIIRAVGTNVSILLLLLIHRIMTSCQKLLVRSASPVHPIPFIAFFS